MQARVKSISSLEFSVFPLCLVVGGGKGEGLDLTRISFIFYLLTHAPQSSTELCAISASSDHSSVSLAEDVTVLWLCKLNTNFIALHYQFHSLGIMGENVISSLKKSIPAEPLAFSVQYFLSFHVTPYTSHLA